MARDPYAKLIARRLNQTEVMLFSLIRHLEGTPSNKRAMRQSILTIFFLFFVAFSVSAQQYETYGSDDKFSIEKTDDGVLVRALQKPDDNERKVQFAGRMGDWVQVIDEDCNVAFLDAQLEYVPADSVDFGQMFFVCGTVNNFEISILDSSDYFNVVMRYGYNIYDYEYMTNDAKRKVIARIPKTEADSLSFLNGEQQITYDENDAYISGYRMSSVIIYHNGQQYFASDPENKYDSIALEDGLVRVRQGGLVANYNRSKTFYRSIGQYNHHLARIQRQDGTYGYVDRDGKEYCGGGKKE